LKEKRKRWVSLCEDGGRLAATNEVCFTKKQSRVEFYERHDEGPYEDLKEIVLQRLLYGEAPLRIDDQQFGDQVLRSLWKQHPPITQSILHFFSSFFQGYQLKP